MKKIMFLCLILMADFQPVLAADYPFTFHKLKSGVAGPTILIIGGIQGDEPGGFTAASLLVTDYEITRGEVWVVPNLNFESIIKRSRGVYGDMNRKFLDIPANDPEYQTITKIKNIITDQQIFMILNLHDGSGFYNSVYVDKNENPRRWGQSIVIDQATIESEAFGNLEVVARNAMRSANTKTSSNREKFRLKNTRTREGDKEMEKTLTYFAVRNGKAAMGVEASKSYPTERRIFNHLRFVEAMFEQMGIEFKRNFKLSARTINRKLGRDIQLVMYNNKILYDFDTPRKRINYVPIQKNSTIEFSTNNPLVAIVNTAKSYKVRYGNRGFTTLKPEYFDYDDSLSEVPMEIDGVKSQVPIGSMVTVSKNFMIRPMHGRRTNVIGYRKPGQRNESGLLIHKKQISSRFSVDKQAEKYRVEFYKGKKYSGMILIDFSDNSKIKAAAKKTMPTS
jgi:hypothetical protein